MTPDLTRQRAEEAWTDQDRAIVEEAKRRSLAAGSVVNHEAIPHGILWDIAMLARTGWTPPEPVDGDLIEAREICARIVQDQPTNCAERYLAGDWDDAIAMRCALLAIKQTRQSILANRPSDGELARVCRAAMRANRGTIDAGWCDGIRAIVSALGLEGK